MTFPNTVDTVTLSVGPVLDAGGTPRRGVPLRATLSTRVRILSSGSVLPSTATAHTDADGEASVVLVATDSGGVDVTGWTYRVTCPGTLVTGGVDVALPAAAPAVRVEDLVAVAASDGETVNLPLITADAAIAGLISDADSDTRAAIDALDLGGGVTDHGALDGLADDDHPQYHTDARGDARYSPLGHAHTLADVTGTVDPSGWRPTWIAGGVYPACPWLSMSAGTAYAGHGFSTPILAPVGATISAVSIKVVATNASPAWLLVYNDQPHAGGGRTPYQCVASLGSVSVSTTGVKTLSGLSHVVAAGQWLVLAVQGGQYTTHFAIQGPDLIVGGAFPLLAGGRQFYSSLSIPASPELAASWPNLEGAASTTNALGAWLTAGA